MPRKGNALLEALAGPYPYLDPREMTNAMTPAASPEAAGIIGGFIPGVGDALGLVQDAGMYATDPSSRTWGNALLSAAALIPGIPRVPKKLYRGTQEGGKTLGTAMLGKGLYSSTSRKFAQQYATDPKTGKVTGNIMEIAASDAFPKNPLILPGYGRGPAHGVFNEWLLEQSGEKNIRDFFKKWPDPGEFVKSKGYDGVWIGEEIVKY